MIDNMTYSRSRRCYRVVDPASGNIVEFPSGRDGRQAAFQMAVASQDIRLYRLAKTAIDKAPLLESRIWRACELVLSQGVRLVQNGETFALVASSNEYGDYVTKKDGKQWLCECEDFRSGYAPLDATGVRCKHTLAAEFAAELTQIRCYHCESPNDLEEEYCTACGELVTPY